MALSMRLNLLSSTTLRPRSSSAPPYAVITFSSPIPSLPLPTSPKLPLRTSHFPSIKASSSSSSSTTITEPEGIKVFLSLSLSLHAHTQIYDAHTHTHVCFSFCILDIGFSQHLGFLFFFFLFLKINSIPTKPIEGQKTGTSGLRKKVALIVLSVRELIILFVIDF
jgi:hypothetical protein